LDDLVLVERVVLCRDAVEIDHGRAGCLDGSLRSGRSQQSRDLRVCRCSANGDSELVTQHPQEGACRRACTGTARVNAVG
jgi:hypothetical protein